MFFVYVPDHTSILKFVHPTI